MEIDHFSSKQLRPGDTLYVRGGTYYEVPTLQLQGSTEKPISIRAYPDELVVLDADVSQPLDARPSTRSAAIKAGIVLPAS